MTDEEYRELYKKWIEMINNINTLTGEGINDEVEQIDIQYFAEKKRREIEATVVQPPVVFEPVFKTEQGCSPIQRQDVFRIEGSIQDIPLDFRANELPLLPLLKSGSTLIDG